MTAVSFVDGAKSIAITRSNCVIFIVGVQSKQANDIAILASTADGVPHLPNFDCRHKVDVKMVHGSAFVCLFVCKKGEIQGARVSQRNTWSIIQRKHHNRV